MFAEIVSGVLSAAVISGGVASGGPLPEHSSPAPVVVVRSADDDGAVSPLVIRDAFCEWITFLC